MIEIAEDWGIYRVNLIISEIYTQHSIAFGFEWGHGSMCANLISEIPSHCKHTKTCEYRMGRQLGKTGILWDWGDSNEKGYQWEVWVSFICYHTWMINVPEYVERTLSGSFQLTFQSQRRSLVDMQIGRFYYFSYCFCLCLGLGFWWIANGIWRQHVAEDRKKSL